MPVKDTSGPAPSLARAGVFLRALVQSVVVAQDLIQWDFSSVASPSALRRMLTSVHTQSDPSPQNDAGPLVA
jgi:hypothetical protein